MQKFVTKPVNRHLFQIIKIRMNGKVSVSLVNIYLQIALNLYKNSLN